MFPNLVKFRNSSSYWKERYLSGGNSGPGSYGRLAVFKGEVINDFIDRNEIGSLIEIGCGDGNQFNYFKVNKYIGVDISDFIVRKHATEFKGDKSKKFINYNSLKDLSADLSISLDVVFHLIEDKVYEEYMFKLFQSSTKFVIIYSSNDEMLNNNSAPHVKHRNFTKWVENNMTDFKLVDSILNKYPYNGDGDTSFCDFYIFRK